MTSFVQRQISGFLGVGDDTLANQYAPESNLWSMQDVSPTTILKVDNALQNSGTITLAASGTAALTLPQAYDSANQLYCYVSTDVEVKAVTVSPAHSTSTVMVTSIGSPLRGILSFVDRVTSLTLTNTSATSAIVRYFFVELPDLTSVDSWRSGYQTLGVVSS